MAQEDDVPVPERRPTAVVAPPGGEASTHAGGGLRLVTPDRSQTDAAPRSPVWASAVLVLIGLFLGASSLWYGLYNVSVWGPFAIVVMVLVIALVAGERVTLSRSGWVAGSGAIG